MLNYIRVATLKEALLSQRGEAYRKSEEYVSLLESQGILDLEVEVLTIVNAYSDIRNLLHERPTSL